MSTMLIVSAVLFIATASGARLTTVSSSAASDHQFVPFEAIVRSTGSSDVYQERLPGTSAPYEDPSQSGTTVNAIKGPYLPQTLTYSPYRYYDEKIQNQAAGSRSPTRGEARQSTKVLQSPHSGFQASPEDGYRSTLPIQQQRNIGATRGDQNPQYLATTKNNVLSAAGPSLYPKFKLLSTAPANRRYPSGSRDHSFESHPKFRSAPGAIFNGKFPLDNSPRSSKNPYRNSPFGGNQNLHSTSPVLSAATSGFESFNNPENYLYGKVPSFGYTDEKIARPFQLQHSPAVSGFLRASNPQSTHVSSNHQAHQSPGIDFQSKPGNGYQLLANQPQLHFTAAPVKSNADRQTVIYHSRPFDEIRTDVEVIDKKKQPPPRTDDSDERDFDEDFKPVIKDSGSFPVRNNGNSRPRKIPERTTNFQTPTSNFFKSYDEAFGKYSKLASQAERTKEKPRAFVHETPKPVYQSIEDEDDDNSDKSAEYRSSSYTDGEASIGSYEDEDEQESRTSARQEDDSSSSEENDRDDDKTTSYRSYGDDFEKDFEDSYRKDLPKSNYKHVKEVPSIDESTSESKKQPATTNLSKTSRGVTKQKSRRVIQNDQGSEPKLYETHTTNRYERRPKGNYRDNEGHGSASSYKATTTTASSEPPVEQSYGHKIPRDRGTSKYRRKENVESNLPKDEYAVQRSGSIQRDLSGI